MPLRCSSDSTARRSLSASMAARSLVASVPTAGGPPANRVASRMQGSTSLLAGMSMTPFSQLTQTCHVSAAGLPSRPTSTTPGAAGAALTSTPAPDTCVANDVLLQVGQAARDDFGLPISSTAFDGLQSPDCDRLHSTPQPPETDFLESTSSVLSLSPKLSQSISSEPCSETDLSDYCINMLFEPHSNHCSTSTPGGLNVSSTSDDGHLLAKHRFSFHFPRFWTCNIRGGFCSKIDEITEVVMTNNIDVAVLVETWLHRGIHNDLVGIPGYTAYRNDRTDGRSGGGILVYIRDGLPCQPLPQLDQADMETVWLLYRRSLMPREVSHILIGAVYHPPRADNSKMIDHLLSSMDNITKEHPYAGIIILGDFNQLPDTQLRSYPLKQVVTRPTRNTAILDKIYTNISHWFEPTVILPAITKSDHESVLITPSACPQRSKRHMIQFYRRSSDPSGKALLCYHIQHFDWKPLFCLQNCAAMVDYFYSVIMSLLNYYLPLLSYTKSSTDKPWVTPIFRDLVKSRQRAFLAGDVILYHRLRNRTQRMAHKLRKNYFTAKVEQLHDCDPHRWWTKTKRILKIEDSNPLSHLDFQGSSDSLADAINDFFVSVSEQLPKVSTSVLAELVDDYSSDFIIHPADVENRLASINIYKAPGADGLPNWLLRDFAPFLSQPLAAIFNASVREGYMPPIWKTADVIPVPKIPRPRSIQTD